MATVLVPPHLESTELQSAVAAVFARDLPVAAICHGTVLAALARRGPRRAARPPHHLPHTPPPGRPGDAHRFAHEFAGMLG